MTTDIEYEHAQKQLKKIERSRTGRRLRVPVFDEPLQEVGRLVDEHRRITTVVTQQINLTKGKVDRETGEEIAPPLGGDAQAFAEGFIDSLNRRLRRTERDIEHYLKKTPVWNEVLAPMAGVGALTGGYLATKLSMTAREDAGLGATKPSHIIAYCGNSVEDGNLRRPKKGEKRKYSQTMRTRLYLAGDSMWKARNMYGGCKYTDIWEDYRHRMQHSPRVVWGVGAKTSGEHSGLIVRGNDVEFAEALRNGNASWSRRSKKKGDADRNAYEIVMTDGRKCSARSAKAFIHSTGRLKAFDVLLEDVYTLWRALEGLPVWPSWYAAKLGYEHGGKIAVNGPRELTLDEAREVVGFTGWRGAEQMAAE